VCSSLGKGVAAAAIGSLLESSGLSVTLVKCDPYINLDAANMDPYQQGEVYVTDDGSETDSDIGTFARFTSFTPARDHSITIGQIYESVIQNERAGRYNGRTVQVIPHITDEIKRRILNAGMRSGPDVVIVEIGGTVGDIESIPFLEAARQLIRLLGHSNAITIHLTLIPMLTGGEMKTKPTQHSVKKMQEIGIQPDILLCRSELPLDSSLYRKIALFCNVNPDAVFSTVDVEQSIYELPVLFHKQRVDKRILARLGFPEARTNIRPWTTFLNRLVNPKRRVTIALVSKNTRIDDCYKSLREALLHAAVTTHNAELNLRKVDAEKLEHSDVAAAFSGVDGIVVPNNFGQRGFLGLLAAVRYARQNRVPFLGIDLGMQLMAIETARSLLNWEDADSTEFVRETSHPVISLPEEQSGLASSGSFKIGLSAIALDKQSKLYYIYKRVPMVSERHRSRYAFDRRFQEDITAKGLRITAFAQDNQTEAFEWEEHPWGIGVQYHPEFSSRPSKPHPVFSAFVGAALGV
jgi:CTP synthase